MKRSDIPGWFSWTDQQVFGHFLSHRAVEPFGDLVEIGAYLGKSAVLLGDYLRDDETFTVIDLFGEDAQTDEANERENAGSYRGLTRAKFEENYAHFHDRPPVIVQALSSTIVDHVAPSSARFLHIDGSHLYEHVATDAQSAQRLAKAGAVIAFDDYRSVHTPGTAAAIWEAAILKDLKIIALTPSKLYGTFDADAEQHRRHLETWLREFGRLNWEHQDLLGSTIVRIWPEPS